MECAIRQYEIPLCESSVSWGKKISLFFAICCLMFSFRWIIESFLHEKHQPILEALIMPVVFGVWFGFRPLSRWFPRGASLTIGQDFIEVRMRLNFFRYKKRIRREEIKSISEGKRGLRVIDRGRFGTLRFILVSAKIPEYQEIRSELALWAPVKVTS